MSFCPSCGSRLFSGDKFCTRCGANIDEFQVESKSESVGSSGPPEKEITEDLNEEKTEKSGKSGKGFLLLLFLVVIAAGGYLFFVVNKDKITTMLSGKDQTAVEAPASESPGNLSPAKSGKGVSSIDIKPSEYDKTDKQDSETKSPSAAEPPVETTPVSDKGDDKSKPAPVQAKPAEVKKVTAPAKTSAVKKSVVLYSNWNKNLPLINNPVIGKNKLTVSEPVMITKITTYHWNYGRGDERGGEISLIGAENYGPFATKKTVAGDDGTPNAKWIFEPGVVLKPGSYRIEMPKDKKKTWSYNIDSEGKGFVIVEGYYTSN